MSDKYAEKVDGEKVAVPDDRGVTLFSNGQVEFKLPSNFVMAHGLLGMASAKLTELQMVTEFEKRQPARGGLNGLLKKATGG